MDDLTAVLIVEGVEPVESEETHLAAWQHLVDTGLVWLMHGWFGRTAVALIEAGQIRPVGAVGERVTPAVGCGNPVRARTR
jgi:hypothetical protein